MLWKVTRITAVIFFKCHNKFLLDEFHGNEKIKNHDREKTAPINHDHENVVKSDRSHGTENFLAFHGNDLPFSRPSIYYQCRDFFPPECHFTAMNTQYHDPEKKSLARKQIISGPWFLQIKRFFTVVIFFPQQFWKK